MTLGVIEKRAHQKQIDAIQHRVNINGVRGKSTVTRLVTSLMDGAGYKTMGKTTGTSPRMIFPGEDREEDIIRNPEGANINEQKRVVKRASDMGVGALVSECMAVNPDYQKIFQKDMLQANIGVIVNVLEDHMDVLGPTVDHVAKSFEATIPYNGWLVIPENEYVAQYRAEAKRRGTKVIVVSDDWVSDEYLKQFPFMIFPQNVALGLGVAEAMGISKNDALAAMLRCSIDPGAMRIIRLNDPKNPTYFFNGFAVNDASSTINVWHRIEQLGYPKDNLTVMMNCRSDRYDRTEQFAKDVLPNIPMDRLIVIGKECGPIRKAYKEGRFKASEFIDLEGKGEEHIVEKIKTLPKGSVFYGVGNIHGAAEAVVEIMKRDMDVGTEKGSDV